MPSRFTGGRWRSMKRALNAPTLENKNNRAMPSLMPLRIRASSALTRADTRTPLILTAFEDQSNAQDYRTSSWLSRSRIIEPIGFSLEKMRRILFFASQNAFLRDRTVFLVGLHKNGSQKRDKGMPGPLLIEVQVQLRSSARMRPHRNLNQ